MFRIKKASKVSPFHELNSFEILHAWISSPSALKMKGYTIKRLAYSCEQHLMNGHILRGLAQYRIMRLMQPTLHEAAYYEKSGQALANHGYAKQALVHYTKAFDAGFRPPHMNITLGQYALKQGLFEEAKKAFDYQLTLTPKNALVLNELGVMSIMQAAKQDTEKNFERLQAWSIFYFKQSLEINDDAIVNENKEIASILKFEAEYNDPEQYLKPNFSYHTRIARAFMIDINRNKIEEKYVMNFGLTFFKKPKGGSFCIKPVGTIGSVIIPRSSNCSLFEKISKINNATNEKISNFLS